MLFAVAVLTITYVTIVGRRGQILVLLASEDVNSNKMALGVTVLACL